MENNTQNTTTQDENKPKQFAFGERPPITTGQYEVEYIYPTFEDDAFTIIHQNLNGKVTVRTFKRKDEEGTYDKIGLGILGKSNEGKERELIVPITVYTEMIDCFNEYGNKLQGYKVKRRGTGKQTKYTIFPVLQ